MFPLVSIGLGIAVFGGTLVAARLTRDPHHFDGDLLSPMGTIDVVERGRPRVWPAVFALGGVVLALTGLAGLGSPDGAKRLVAAEATARPTLIEVAAPATPEPTASPTPRPSDDAAAAPTVTPATSPAPGTGGAPGSASAPAPTPTPKPGPEASTTANCNDAKIWVGYSITARDGTTISSVRISGAGETHDVSGVSGASRHTGTWQRSVAPGPHTVTLTARGSDGGVTQRHHHVDC